MYISFPVIIQGEMATLSLVQRKWLPLPIYLEGHGHLYPPTQEENLTKIFFRIVYLLTYFSRRRWLPTYLSRGDGATPV